jgi:hypothetical protein
VKLQPRTSALHQCVVRMEEHDDLTVEIRALVDEGLVRGPRVSIIHGSSQAARDIRGFATYVHNFEQYRRYHSGLLQPWSHLFTAELDRILGTVGNGIGPIFLEIRDRLEAFFRNDVATCEADLEDTARNVRAGRDPLGRNINNIRYHREMRIQAFIKSSFVRMEQARLEFITTFLQLIARYVQPILIKQGANRSQAFGFLCQPSGSWTRRLSHRLTSIASRDERSIFHSRRTGNRV